MAFLALALSLGGCQGEPVAARQFFVFGTLVDITLYDVQAPLAETAFETAQTELRAMHHAWHAWKPGKLARVNAHLANATTTRLDPELAGMIRAARRLARASDNLFDPAIGKLIGLWGFHDDELTDHAPPAPAQIDELVAARPTMDDLVIEDSRVSSRNRDVQLDFGGFAKGYAIDTVIQHFQALGIDNAIVNAGGDLRALGHHGERPWRIGIRRPDGPGVIASVEIAGDEAVFTSGDYERFFEHDGRRYHHILDPRTGYPARGVASVTVIHPQAATADAAATALFVAGPEHWRALARRMGVRYVLLLDKRGRAHMTPAMAARIRFEIEPPPPVVSEDAA